MSKKNLILGGILIVLAVFAWVWSGPLKNWKENGAKEKNFLSGLALDEIGKIEITRGGVATVLEKTGDRWKISGSKDFFAGAEAAADLSAIFSEIGAKQIESVSSSRDKKSFFGTDEKGLKVKVEQGGRSFEFIVGKNTPDFSGSYISSASSDKTYEIGLDLNSVFGREEWRDQTIFSFLKERVTKIRFQYGKANFIAEKKDNKWGGTEPWKFPVADEKITAVLGVLENLTAAKIPAQDFKGTGLEKNSQIVQVVGDGLDDTLMVGDCTKDDLCYVKTAANDNIYLITKANRDVLNKKIADLK
jgi:hypothetical protein